MSPRALTDIEGSPTPYVTVIDQLRGVDFTSAPINVAEGRAYNAPNMIRDVPGKVRKRMGYERVYQFNDPIYGIFDYFGTMFVHAGTELFYWEYDVATHEYDFLRVVPAPIEPTLPAAPSHAYLVGKKMVILTGEGMYIYYRDDLGIRHIGEAGAYAKIPEVTIGRPPAGGGDTYPFNMLTPFYTDCFLSDGTSTVYQLSYYPLGSANVEVLKVNNNGTWSTVPDTDYDVDVNAGTVTFHSAPPLPPVSGEDNIKITASVPDGEDSDFQEMRAKLYGCTFGVVYGAGGQLDRLFISGNVNYQNNDWYCDVNDPTMWGDINYGQIGQQDSPITGYSIVDGKLATHKSNEVHGRNIYIREGKLDLETEDLMPTEFPITGIIQGKGAIAPFSFAYLDEPLYLTGDGVYATTPYEFNGMWYAQKRSYYLDGKLLKMKDLRGAIACAWKDFYLLSIGDEVFILDTLQRDGSGIVRDSQFQYEAYHFTGIQVNCWFPMQERYEYYGYGFPAAVKDRLVFGSADGCLYSFFTDTRSGNSYLDGYYKVSETGEEYGRPIQARWEFTQKGNFYLDKDMYWIALSIDTTPVSSFDIYYRRAEDGSYEKLQFDNTIRFFAYDEVDYAHWVYSGSSDPKTVGHTLKMKRYDSCHISIRNERGREGIFLYAIALEYEEGRNYKQLRETTE